ncbi:arylamine N-acetyltransferase [Streptomyces sp. NPDC016845]|uniref:arylamine N-acetyltransferase n=1 Tax=Streptomyces sp. NPDC016845 TaxID=3364972 RepID=UPI0037B2ECF5
MRLNTTSLRPMTHMLTRVQVDDEEWLCDVGFGAAGLREPLLLRDGQQVTQGAWEFGIVKEGEDVWVLGGRRPDDWHDVYAFTLEERHPVDCTVLNHYTSSHPRSTFMRRPVVQYGTEDARRMLTGEASVIAYADGRRVERAVRATELRTVLDQEFGVELSDDDLSASVRTHYTGE